MPDTGARALCISAKQFPASRIELCCHNRVKEIRVLRVDFQFFWNEWSEAPCTNKILTYINNSNHYTYVGLLLKYSCHHIRSTRTSYKCECLCGKGIEMDWNMRCCVFGTQYNFPPEENQSRWGGIVWGIDRKKKEPRVEIERYNYEISGKYEKEISVGFSITNFKKNSQQNAEILNILSPYGFYMYLSKKTIMHHSSKQTPTNSR